jgi:hypothetical protein
MIITTWQETSDSLNVSVVSEEHWASLGQFNVRLGTSAVYLTLKEIINLKRKISDAEREYFDDYIYGKETA